MYLVNLRIYDGWFLSRKSISTWFNLLYLIGDSRDISYFIYAKLVLVILRFDNFYAMRFYTFILESERNWEHLWIWISYFTV